MTRAILVALGTGAAISSAAALGIAASNGDEPRSFTHAEYGEALRAVEAAREEAGVRCDAAAPAEREVCRAEAAATAMVRVAQIESDYRRNQPAARALQRARIDARYQVERARCNALAGFRRDQCMVNVHAARGRSMLHVAAPYEVRYNP